MLKKVTKQMVEEEEGKGDVQKKYCVSHAGQSSWE